MRHFVVMAFCVASLISVSLAQEGKSEEKKTFEATEGHKKAVAALRELGANVLEIAQNDARLDVSLHLCDKEVKDDHLALLKEFSVPVLWLNLARTKITDAGLANISGIKSLEKLHLEKTGIGDEGLKHLKNLENLTYLNLYSTQVTDAGLEHLKNLKKLRRLYLWESKVTDAGVATLQKELPDVKIIRGVEPAKKVEEPKAEEKKPEEKKEEPKKEEKKEPEKKEEEKKN